MPYLTYSPTSSVLSATPSEYSKLPSLGNGLENTRGNALDTHPSSLRQGFGSATPKGGYFVPTGNPAVDSAQMARGLRPLTPSTGSPPPTPMTGGVSPTGIPTGSPPTPLTNTPSPRGIPTGVRSPISGVKLGGTAALIGVGDFASRISEGQSIGDAAKGASYTTAGSFAGGAIGFALGGPIGGMVGSMVGGSFAGAVYDAAFPRPASTEPQPPYEPVQYPELQYPTGIRIRFFSPNNNSFTERVVTSFSGGMFKGVRVVNFTQTSGTPGSLEWDPATLTFPGPEFGDVASEQPGGNRRSIPRGAPASPVVSNPPASVPSSSAPGAAKIPGGAGGIPAGRTPETPPDTSNRGLNPPAIAPSPRATLTPAPGQPTPTQTPNPFQTPMPGPGNKGQITPVIGGLSSPSPDRLSETATPPGEPRTVRQTTKTPTESLAPMQPAPTPEQSANDIIERLKQQDAMLVGLAATVATLLANPLFKPEELENAVARGTCKTAGKGGCMGNRFDAVEGIGNANGSKLDALNAAANAGDALGTAALGAKLDRIDTKLGPQIPGNGISGKLLELFDWTKDLANKTWNALGLDRVVSVLTLVASLHNAAMLSRELGETLVETANTVVQALQAMIPGFLKKPDGENLEIDIGEVLSTKVENFLKATLGTENYFSLKAEWMKANRILTATSNALSAMRGMTNAVTDGLESVQTCVSQGFNGIQREGLVSDKTWPWMDETPNFKPNQITRFTNRIENAEDATSSIQQIAQAPIEFVSEAKELTEATTELKKALDEDSKKTAADEAKKDAESESADLDNDDLLPGS